MGYVCDNRGMGANYKKYSLIYYEITAEIGQHVSRSVREPNGDELSCHEKPHSQFLDTYHK